MVLLGGVAVCAGVGALIGWSAGSTGDGVLGGVVVGLPVGVASVYRRYKRFFT